MEDFSCLIVDNDRLAGYGVDISGRGAARVHAVCRRVTLAEIDRFVNLVRGPTALPHLTSPLLRRFMPSKSQAMALAWFTKNLALRRCKGNAIFARLTDRKLGYAFSVIRGGSTCTIW
jgi:hypothetical protein